MHEYFSWQKEQQKQRHELEKYLKLTLRNEKLENEDTVQPFYKKSSSRVHSPLYLLNRSSNQKQRTYSNQPKILETVPVTKNIEGNTISNPNVLETRISKTHLNNSISLEEESLSQTNTCLGTAIKESRAALPREFIEARSAFDTIKTYCKQFITASLRCKPSNRNENSKASTPLNFFGKPIVEHPISLP